MGRIPKKSDITFKCIQQPETDLCPRTSVGLIRAHSQKGGRKIRIGY